MARPAAGDGGGGLGEGEGEEAWVDKAGGLVLRDALHALRKAVRSDKARWGRRRRAGAPGGGRGGGGSHATGVRLVRLWMRLVRLMRLVRGWMRLMRLRLAHRAPGAHSTHFSHTIHNPGAWCACGVCARSVWRGGMGCWCECVREGVRVRVCARVGVWACGRVGVWACVCVCARRVCEWGVFSRTWVCRPLNGR